MALELVLFELVLALPFLRVGEDLSLSEIGGETESQPDDRDSRPSFCHCASSVL
jgi:hypothetical protein